MSVFISQNNKVIYSHLNHFLKSYYYTTGYSIYAYDQDGVRLDCMQRKELLSIDKFIDDLAKKTILTKINIDKPLNANDSLLLEIHENLYTIAVPVYSNKLLITFLFIEPFFIDEMPLFEKRNIFEKIKRTQHGTLCFKNYRQFNTISQDKLNYLGQLFFHLMSNCIYIGQQHFVPKKEMSDTQWGKSLSAESLNYTNSFINVPVAEKICDYLYCKDIDNALKTYKAIQTFISLPSVNQCPVLMTKYYVVSIITLIYYNLSKHFVALDSILYKIANDCILNLKLYNGYCDIIQYGELVINKFYKAIENQCFTNVSPNIYKAITYINNNYKNKLKLSDIANSIPMNATYLSTQFKKEMQISLNQYINNYRIKQAINLLKNGSHNLTNIALSVGFDSANYFSTVFKKNTGLTPSEYSKQSVELLNA